MTKAPQHDELAACPFCAATTAELYEAEDIGGYKRRALSSPPVTTAPGPEAEAGR